MITPSTDIHVDLVTKMTSRSFTNIERVLLDHGYSDTDKSKNFGRSIRVFFAMNPEQTMARLYLMFSSKQYATISLSTENNESNLAYTPYELHDRSELLYDKLFTTVVTHYDEKEDLIKVNPETEIYPTLIFPHTMDEDVDRLVDPDETASIRARLDYSLKLCRVMKTIGFSDPAIMEAVLANNFMILLQQEVGLDLTSDNIPDKLYDLPVIFSILPDYAKQDQSEFGWIKDPAIKMMEVKRLADTDNNTLSREEKADRLEVTEDHLDMEDILNNPGIDLPVTPTLFADFITNESYWTGTGHDPQERYANGSDKSLSFANLLNAVLSSPANPVHYVNTDQSNLILVFATLLAGEYQEKTHDNSIQIKLHTAVNKKSGVIHFNPVFITQGEGDSSDKVYSLVGIPYKSGALSNAVIESSSMDEIDDILSKITTPKADPHHDNVDNATGKETDNLTDAASTKNIIRTSFPLSVVREALRDLPFNKITTSEVLVKALLLYVKEHPTALSESVDTVFTEATQSDRALRTKIQSKIIKYMQTVDKSGVNANKYKAQFGKMSDSEFLAYMRKFVKSSDNFYMEFLPNTNYPKLQDVLDGLKTLGVPKDEYVYYRHDGNADNPLRTRYKVPVGYISVKRMQQMLAKKNSYGLEVSKRNQLTGSLSAAEKVAMVSDMESNALEAIGAHNALKEFLGARADSQDAKNQLYTDISTYGYSRLGGLPDNIDKKKALNTMSYLLLGAGIDNDLLQDDQIFIPKDEETN